MASVKRCLSALWSLRELLILVVTPIVLCPLLINGSSEASCGYVLILVSVFWIFEVLPISVTALIPLFLFPILGVMDAASLAKAYAGDIIFFVFGSLCIALTMEKWNLHKRIAYLSLLLVGANPGSILLAFMLISFFLSMWMMNTATAVMILPIAKAIAEKLNEQNEDEKNVSEHHEMSSDVPIDNDNDLAVTVTDVQLRGGGKTTENGTELGNDDQKPDNISKAFMLGIAYCSLMGGSASLVGTAQVIVLKQFIDDNYGSSVLTFTSWLAVAVPCQVISIVIGWLWLQCLFLNQSCLCRQRKCCSIKGKKYQVDKKCSIRVYIRAELKALGPVSWAEGSVLVLFILSILVWFFADPVIFPGWVQLDKGGYVSITTASVLIPISIFILPADPRGAYRRFKKDVKRRFEWEKLMDMKTMQAKYPWLIIFIVLGCLLSMGKAAQASGLSSWVANQLSDIRLLDPWAIVLILTVVIAILCEALGNVSVVVFVLPILSDLADDMQVNPLYFIVPSVLAASFAFMLPVASGPNIIAYSYGNLKVMDMVKAGFPMNIICIVIVNICTHTLCVWVFDIYTFPDWAQRPRGIPNTTMPTTLNSTTYDMLQT